MSFDPISGSVRFGHGVTCLAFAFFSTLPAVRADEPATLARLTSDPSVMDDVVVTATRTPRSRSDVGSTISVITAEEIEARQYTFALEALRSLPGVVVNQNSPFGGVASVALRGAKSEQTLVMVDGIEVNDPSTPGGSFNFSSLDVADIERIEVLRGPQSTLYGSDAIGGVISIITKSGEAGFNASGFLEAGSFETVRGAGTVSGRQDRVDYRLTASGLISSGISAADEDRGNSERDGHDNSTLSGKVGFQATENFKLDLVGRYIDSRNRFDSFDFVNGVTDGDEISFVDELYLKSLGELSLFDGALRNEIAVEWTDVERRNVQNGATTFRADGERLNFEYQGDIILTDWAIATIGTEVEEIRIKTATEDAGNRIISGFGLLQVEPYADLSLSLGVRRDEHDTFGGVTPFRFTGAYALPWTGTILRGSWGEGFKAPTPFQLSFIGLVSMTANTDLKPEESRGFDIGLEQDFLAGKLNTRLTYFANTIDDQIDFSFVTLGFENLSKVETEGVEAEIQASPLDWLDLALSYFYLEAEDAGADTRLIRRPKHSGSLDVTSRPMTRLTLGGSLVLNGAEADSRGRLGGYGRVDLRAAYQLSDRLTVTGRIENLLDKDYQDTFGFGTPGISAYAGLRARL